MKISPILTARIIFEKTTEWKRSGLNIEKISNEIWVEFFKNVANNPAIAEVADRIFINILSDEKSNVKDEIKKFTNTTYGEADLNENITKSLKNGINKNISEYLIHKQVMGKVMVKLRGIIQGKIVSDKIWKEMNRQEA